MNTPRESVTLVPVKPGPAGKSRLATVLDDAGRTVLIAWMLDRVLTALDAARAGPVYVVGADAVLEEVAARHRCRVLPELGRNHNDTLARAIQATTPARRWLIVAADLPLIASDDIRSMAIDDDAIALLAPSHDGDGTNALLLPAACAITPQFGAHSRSRHLAALAAAGCRTREVNRRGFEFDVDRPSDLDSLLAAVTDDERRLLSAALRPDRGPRPPVRPV